MCYTMDIRFIFRKYIIDLCYLLYRVSMGCMQGLEISCQCQTQYRKQNAAQRLDKNLTFSFVQLPIIDHKHDFIILHANTHSQKNKRKQNKKSAETISISILLTYDKVVVLKFFVKVRQIHF